MPKARYKRLVLKLSGTFLATPEEPLLSPKQLKATADLIASVYQHHQPLQLVIVTGAGNLLRGRDINRVISKGIAHSLGMMGTVINAAALAESLRNSGIKARFLSALHIPQVTESYTQPRALELLEENKVVVVGGGVGIGYLSTDTAAIILARQLNCQVVLKATDVDGAYDTDPQENPGAKQYEKLSFDEAISKDLKIMDRTAFVLAKEGRIPLVIFNFADPTALEKLLSGERVGTIIQENPQD